MGLWGPKVRRRLKSYKSNMLSCPCTNTDDYAMKQGCFHALGSRRNWQKKSSSGEKIRAGELLVAANAKTETWTKANYLAFNTANTHPLLFCFCFDDCNFKSLKLENVLLKHSILHYHII